MMRLLNTLFQRNNTKSGKWHEVRWRNGPRQIFMALRFANGSHDRPPVVEQLPPEEDRSDLSDAGGAATRADEALVVKEIQSAVTEYNRMNLCALRVAGVRLRATDDVQPADFATATRKLLNLL
jgi:hypothetical protein